MFYTCTSIVDNLRSMHYYITWLSIIVEAYLATYGWFVGVPPPNSDDFSPGLMSTLFSVVLGSPHRLCKLPQPLAPTEDNWKMNTQKL